MAIAKLFKSRAQVMGYVFRSGKSIHFINHVYTTNDQKEIDELTEEANSGHPNIYIDPEMVEIDTDKLDPMAVLIARIREEERAKWVSANSHSNDMGTSDSGGKLQGIANSNSIRDLQVSSDSQAAALSGTDTSPVATRVTSGIKVAVATKL